MYRVTQDFHPVEERHLEAQTGDIVSGMHELNGWILGFTDDKPDTFGFIPEVYLQFIRVPGDKSSSRSQNRTPDAAALAQSKQMLGHIYDNVAA
jgi:hypothetical protein